MLLFGLFAVFVQISNCVVLRVTQNGLQELANFTQQWMSKTIVEVETDTFTHHITKGLGSGSLLFSNTSVEQFDAPTIRYRPSDHSFLYMTALSGQAKVSSDWLMYSKYLSIFGVPLSGKVQMQMAGIKSEVAMQITATNELLVHHCIARVVDLELDFTGSYAAEVLQFFKMNLAKSIRRNMEQQFCIAMKDRLVPWLREQIDTFPTLMRFPISDNVEITHKLHSIAMTNSHIDFRLLNSITWDQDVIEGEAVDYTHFAFADSFEDSSKMVEIFIEEETIQTVASAAHFAEQLRTNVSSPYLRTQCDYMCIGTIFPDLAESFQNSSMRVQVSTLHPPVIRLRDQNAQVFLNASLKVFPDPPLQNMTGPVLEIKMTTEFFLNLQLKHKHFKAFVNVVKSKAEVVHSRIEGLSQQALDFLVNMSTPFLEDAVDVFFGEGMEFSDVFRVPLENEVLSISDGSVRLQTDVVLEQALMMIMY
ncbi:hypothetical protein L596_015649 [Steinernema carpocapsae]|uniref:Lipid-binding serum glycoprotein C-terminal domain-containing protein n=1 Tax=Steinernema carpocapsae TaxID=34508 RepID=A0A4U5NFR9_STECR|nr:hypothetical protein L596_015649 [Steinernema carpocapsae]